MVMMIRGTSLGPRMLALATELPTGSTSVVLVGPGSGVVAAPDSTLGTGFNSSGQRPASSSKDIADQLGGTPRYDRPSKLIWVPIPAP